MSMMTISDRQKCFEERKQLSSHPCHYLTLGVVSKTSIIRVLLQPHSLAFCYWPCYQQVKVGVQSSSNIFSVMHKQLTLLVEPFTESWLAPQ